MQPSIIAAAAAAPAQISSAQETTLLSGKVVSTTGEALAGVPVKAHLNNTNITVAVYTNKGGEYSFPSWSDVKPGAYTVKIELPDFEHANKDNVSVAAGRTAKVDFRAESEAGGL